MFHRIKIDKQAISAAISHLTLLPPYLFAVPVCVALVLAEVVVPLLDVRDLLVCDVLLLVLDLELPVLTELVVAAPPSPPLLLLVSEPEVLVLEVMAVAVACAALPVMAPGPCDADAV